MAAVPPPVTFRLPAGWHPQPADVAGAGVEVLARHETSDAGFTANITVGLHAVEPPASVAEMAAGAVRRLEATERDVVVRRREELGTAPAVGLGQEVRLTTSVDGADVELTQVQVFLPVVDVADPDLRAVYVATFTATARQAPALLPDFEALVRSIRTAGGDAAPTTT